METYTLQTSLVGGGNFFVLEKSKGAWSLYLYPPFTVTQHPHEFLHILAVTSSEACRASLSFEVLAAFFFKLDREQWRELCDKLVTRGACGDKAFSRSF